MKACAHEEEEKADPEISHPGIIIQSETAKRKQELTLDLNLEEPPQMVHYLFTIYQLFVYAYFLSAYSRVYPRLFSCNVTTIWW